MLGPVLTALFALSQPPPPVTVDDGADRMPPSYSEHRLSHVCNGIRSETRLIQSRGTVSMRSVRVGTRRTSAPELARINQALADTTMLRFTSLSCPGSMQMLELHGYTAGADGLTERLVTLFLSTRGLVAVTVNGVEWYRAPPTRGRS